MGRIKRGGYFMEWWVGDHLPKHIHIYWQDKPYAKVQIPGMRLKWGRMNRRLKKILLRLIKEGIIR